MAVKAPLTGSAFDPNPEVLPPQAQNMHPYSAPRVVGFSMQNTVQSPLFWMIIGAGAMWGLHYYFTKDSKKGN